MPADPRVGQSFRQEFYKGHAEDHFRVLSRSDGRLLSREWTPLEPGVIDHKLYRRKVGTVREETVKGRLGATRARRDQGNSTLTTPSSTRTG